jgi:hypothetical protein
MTVAEYEMIFYIWKLSRVDTPGDAEGGAKRSGWEENGWESLGRLYDIW